MDTLSSSGASQEEQGFPASPGGNPHAWPPIAGIDEAGRGPLAGPVVAAAVILCNPVPMGLADSKRLSAIRRARLEAEIRQGCAFGIGVVAPEEIDRLNILGATMLAMSLAMERLIAGLEQGRGALAASREVRALIDGNLTPEGRCGLWRWPARARIGGDASEPAISAASILAKQHRDRLMREAAQKYPAYGWERNKGYGTREHLQALAEHGPSPLHRRSFAPVAQAALL